MPHGESRFPIDRSPVLIQPPGRWPGLGLADLWAHRDLIYFLTWRDIRVRYKQTALGILWVLIQPILSTGVVTLFLGRLVGVGSVPIPYPVFALAGLVPWMFFSRSLMQSTAAVVGSTNLITKVYFPRLVIPTATLLAALFDTVLASVAFVPMMMIYRLPLLPGSLVIFPLAALSLVAFTFGLSLWASSLNVKYRDIGAILPFTVQLLMFASPVIYPMTLLPRAWRAWLMLNPLTGLLECARASVFALPVDWSSFAVSAGVGWLVFVTGVLVFRRLEIRFADVV